MDFKLQTLLSKANLGMAILAGLSFTLSFRVNQLLDAYFVYSPGISLLFIPAGVKLLFVLIGRLPAMIGIMIASVYLGYGIWPDKSILPVIYFAFVSLMTYTLSAYTIMWTLNIRKDLTNLRYWHILVLSLAASITNGIVHNLLYMSQDVTTPDELWTKATAMTLGDFMGCFVVVALFQVAVSRVRVFQTANK